MKDTTYHSILRIAALTLAVVLLFDSGLLLPVTKELSHGTQNYLAQSIGMFAGVEPTELNQLTAELSSRDRILTQRENNVSAREISVDLKKNELNPEYSTYILSAVLFFILVLLILNYALDFARMRRGIEPVSSHEKMA